MGHSVLRCSNLVLFPFNIHLRKRRDFWRQNAVEEGKNQLSFVSESEKNKHTTLKKDMC